MLYNVQVLRAIAALMVVHGHAGAGGLGLEYRIGGLNGVDLFFVISGFIIAYVADSDASHFLTRRLIRIVPIYWVSTLVIFTIALVVPHMMRTTSTDGELLVRSLLFVPDPESSTVFTHNDRLAHPTLAGGWTLNYEMYFYVVFALALMLSRRWATAIATIALSAIVAIVNLTTLDRDPIAHFYGYPIVCEFIFGMLAFHVVREAERRAIAVPRGVLIAAVVAGLVVIGTRVFSDDAPRWISSGVPAFFVVTAAVMLERSHALKVTNRWAVMVGDASYALYLSHAYVVFGIIRLAIGKRAISEPVGQLIVFGLMIASTAVAIAIYKYVEKPMLRVLKRRFIPR